MQHPWGRRWFLGLSVWAPLLFAAWTGLWLSGCGEGGGGPIQTVSFNGPSDHSWFPIEAWPHKGQACDSCHGPFDSFTRFTCIDCHTHDQAITDPVHSAVSGYEYNSFACLSCHPDGLANGGSGVDHTRLFPIAAGSVHASAACSQCHVDPGDRTALGCAGCHPHDKAPTEAVHTKVGGFNFSSRLCVRCHFDAKVARVSAHRPFLIQPGKPHDARVACLNCHTTALVDRPWGQDFSLRTCVGCHDRTPTASIHTRVAGFNYADSDCLGCHPSGEGGIGPVAHEPFFPIGAGSTHAVAACSDCHLDPTNPRAAFGCTTCHLGDHDKNPMNNRHQNPPSGGAVGSLYLWQSTACIECHPRAHVVTRTNHSSRRFDGNNVSRGPHKNKKCSDCHTNRSFSTFNCSPCHDPGRDASEKTQGCDRNKGSTCSATEKYNFYYK